MGISTGAYMRCKECGKEYENWSSGPIENHLCLECNEKKWAEFEEEHKEEYERIEQIKAAGHSVHCACRQVWGDGECECDLYELGYGPYEYQHTTDM
jgi:hypothetical protein